MNVEKDGLEAASSSSTVGTYQKQRSGHAVGEQNEDRRKEEQSGPVRSWNIQLSLYMNNIILAPCCYCDYY